MVALPKPEIFIYFSIWISGVLISLYHLYFVGQVFDHDLHDEYHYEDFKKGWSILNNRFQDQADYEWNSWTNLTIKLFPFSLINLIVAEFLRFKKMNYILPLWYASITIGVVTSFFGVVITLCLLAQATAFYICICLQCYPLIWIVGYLIRRFFTPEIWFNVTDDDRFLIVISSTWMILRCVSFSIDKINDNKPRTLKKLGFDFLVLLGYSLYLPTMFCGPFISYSYFEEGLKLNSQKWDVERVKKIVAKFLRCLFWFKFTEFALHFIYVNAILLRPYLVRDLLDWELAGLGIAMGHFFHLKYIVFYGLPCAWASGEGFKTPELPCCVSRVHLYSYMWRHFDPGLYEFIKKYIYVPVRLKLQRDTFFRKMFTSMICFIFVYIWHGEEDYVFCWAALNFISITIESVGRTFFSNPKVKEKLKSRMSSENILRLQCLLSAPLHYFSMVSNYYFIGMGMDIGKVYFHRFFRGSLRNQLVILFFLYGAGQSAVQIQLREKEKKLKEQIN